jgi:hypothetical protein
MLTVVLAGLAACAGPGSVQRSAPAPALQLVSSTPLKLPATCDVGSSVAIEFVVLPDGETAEVRPISAPDCARAALAAWVASFRYAPPEQRTPSRIEWLVVSASRTI